MATKKQTDAARKNVKKAAKAARGKVTGVYVAAQEDGTRQARRSRCRTQTDRCRRVDRQGSTVARRRVGELLPRPL
jgi:hypothetical protein